jgi:hypothetical protein
VVDVKADQMLGEITCADRPIPSIIQPHCHWRKESSLIYNATNISPHIFSIHGADGGCSDRKMVDEISFE